MFEKFYITPPQNFSGRPNSKAPFTGVIAVKTSDISYIYITGRNSVDKDGKLQHSGDMRGQIAKTCESLRVDLECVGANFGDVVKASTFVTDVEAYFAAIDERFKYFTDPQPAGSLVGVDKLAMPGMLITIVIEAVIDSKRLRVPANAVNA